MPLEPLEPLVFFGPCNRFGSGTSRPEGFCRTLDLETTHSHVLLTLGACFVNMLELEAAVSTGYLQHFGVRTSHFTLLGFNLFKVGSGLLRVGLGSIQGWLKGYLGLV